MSTDEREPANDDREHASSSPAAGARSERTLGIRGKVLAIALVPSLTLLVLGVGVAASLVNSGRQAESFAQAQRSNLEPTRDLVAAVQRERSLSMRQLAGEEIDPGVLGVARSRFDRAMREVQSAQSVSTALGSAEQDTLTEQGKQLNALLPALRAGVDARAATPFDVYRFYSGLLDGVAQVGSRLIKHNSPDVSAAVELTQSNALLQVIEAVSRVGALTAAIASDDRPPAELSSEFRNLVGYYRVEIARVRGVFDSEDATRLDRLTASPAWGQMTAVEQALLETPPAGTTGRQALPFSVEDWRTATDQFAGDLTSLWIDQNERSQRRAADAGALNARNSLLAGIGITVLTVLMILLSLWLANRIINRLERLRAETLALARVQLPDTVRRLSGGERIDPGSATAQLDFGRDEIGTVAEAFTIAYAAAVGAAVEEANTRAGVRSVFLEIAHRSQVVARRQLEILDEAEARQEDPALLETFFRLDHLATRQRRNAENLIILGGGRPGRQWRNPVPLLDLVRSSIAETLEYARVNTARLPAVSVVSSAIADLIHLLAELIDNATMFSPPESRVEITGNTVGRGVVIEVGDQGLGMTDEDMAQANQTLSRPTDFGFANLSQDSRLGLFVVAQLGSRHGISVRLRESDYGGIRAVVLLPSAIIVDIPVEDYAPGEYAGSRFAPWEHVSAEQATMTPALPDTPAASRGIAERPHVPTPEAVAVQDTATLPRIQDARPELPKRRRQTNLAPESTAIRPERGASTQVTRSPEQARNLMSSIENGTRQGRLDIPEPDSNDQEGNGASYFRG
ncbi:sensor histidine kinase [Nocardia bovistercoris]|uniref:histidine kinase n=1 Tax=Nocardia bovistercoris TaxID=2785916 RepID=A0A931IEK5_9NOCA|nr:ATP-binding protein [Nocardia bovistercoris]MBH0779786.1 nitrate- and nitrite sensing domain-containing protein [Nocardia bovistercoris]